MRTSVLRLLALFVLVLLATPSLADIWDVSRLRGQVLQRVDGEWQPLRRGGSIPDDRVVRTGPNGHLALVRGKETIELGPNTQIQIFDKAGTKPFTTVQQQFGTVSIEAEVRNVQHFAVETPFIAAVVKGTRFTVTSGKTGASVEVKRGQVGVEDRSEKSTTVIVAGQRAAVEKGTSMTVAGKGTLPPVLSRTGKPLTPAAKPSQRSDDKASAKAAEKATRDAAKAAEKAARDAQKRHPEGKGSDNGPDPGKGKPGDGPAKPDKGKPDDGPPKPDKVKPDDGTPKPEKARPHDEHPAKPEKPERGKPEHEAKPDGKGKPEPDKPKPHGEDKGKK